MGITFERAQMLALVHARTMGYPPPLAAYPRGLRGKEWYVCSVAHPRAVVDGDMLFLDPDLPLFVVHDDGVVEVRQTPDGPLFEGEEVRGEVVNLERALAEA